MMHVQVIWSLNACAVDTIRYTAEMIFAFMCAKLEFF